MAVGRRDYWGIWGDAFYDAADVWPLDPDGELLLMGIVENADGIRALPEIVKRVRGIGAIWVGPGDLSVSLGYRGDLEHPEVEDAVQQALRVCKSAGVPVGAVGGRKSDAVKRLEQGFDIVVLPPVATAELARARQAAGRGSSS